MNNDLEQLLIAFGKSLDAWATDHVLPILEKFNVAIWDATPQWMRDEYARLQAEKLESIRHKNEAAKLANYLAQFSGEDEDHKLSITWLRPVEQWDLSEVGGAGELPPTTDGSATLLGYVLPEDEDDTP